MAVLKWKNKDGWIEFFKEISADSLSKEKNLADLTDRQIAVQNLGLTGDINTHNHDSRYMKLIEDTSRELTQKVNDLQKTVENQKDTMAQMFYIGAVAPPKPIENMIWFDTGNMLVKTYRNASWTAFSAVYG